MAAPKDIDARRYYLVALQRLEDGKLLFKLSRWNAAIYLSGYAVECILKALILTSTPRNRRDERVASFRGRNAHNIEWLSRQLVGCGVKVPAAHSGQLVYLSSWSTDLRYEAGPGNPQDAGRFLASASAVLKWAMKGCE
jgi:hypothetical protein